MAEMLNGESDVAQYQGLLCPGLLEPSESTSICPLLTPSPSHADMICASLDQPHHDPESVSMCPLLESPPSEMFSHPLDPLAGLAYQQRQQLELSGVGDKSMRRSSLTEDSFAGQIGNSGGTGLAMLDSSSSSSSGLQENPASVTLLNHHYQHLPNDNNEAFSNQDNGGVCLELGVTKGGADYCFVHWNWPVIRTVCFWTVLSTTVACFCIIIGMVASVPKKCQPARSWHQGTLFYEIFPGSFQDSGHDGLGDIRGVASRTEYLKSLGISAIRLNSIFPATHYPDDFLNVLNLTSIDERLGTIDDMKYLLTTLHRNNISVVIDLPIFPLIKSLKESKTILGKSEVFVKKDVADEITNAVHNHRSHRDIENKTTPGDEAEMLIDEQPQKSFKDRKSMLAPYIDGGISGLMKVTSQHLKTISKTVVEEALDFWFTLGIDGIYIKGLEHFANDPHFLSELSNWNKIKLGQKSERQKILMASYKVLERLGEEGKKDVMKTFDLLDIFLEMSNGTHYLADDITKLLNSEVFSEKGNSWLHWNIGNVDTHRLSGRVTSHVGAITFEALLPGTISLFYGDEIGLSDAHDAGGDFEDLEHVHQLSPMQWVNDNTPFSPVLPWLPAGYADHEPVIPLIRAISQLRQSQPSIFMNTVCKDGSVLLNTVLGYVDDSIIVIIRSYPRRHAYAVFYNADIKRVVRDLTHFYYGGMQILQSNGAIETETYIRFKAFSIDAGQSLIIKMDK